MQTASRARMTADPEFFDIKIAGWWVWGLCAWIGSGWCALDSVVSNAGRGVHRKLPHVGDAGMGVHRQLPHVSNAGMGVHRQLPHVGDAGMGVHRQLMQELAKRLRRVRVACGDWSRVCTPSVTFRHGPTGVFLDPPYGAGRLDYSGGGNADTGLAESVRAWAVENGEKIVRGARVRFDPP